MTTIKITAKRQTVLPKALCQVLHVGPGDHLEAEVIERGNRRVMALSPVRKPRLPCFGMLRKYAKGKNHDWAAIQKAIEQGWTGEEA